MERKVLLLVLVLASLVVAGLVFAQFDVPTVDTGLTETPLTEGVPAIGVANVSANESEENDGIPESWQALYWSSNEEFREFQRYINRTEIEIKWTYNTNGEKIIGEVMVDRESLYKGPLLANDGDIGEEYRHSAYKYFAGERKGHCRIVSTATYKLLTLWIQGEDIRIVSADNIDYNPDYPNGHHYWVEWIDDEGEWVSDYGNVWPKEYWYQRYDWTVNWRQEAP